VADPRGAMAGLAACPGGAEGIGVSARLGNAVTSSTVNTAARKAPWRPEVRTNPISFILAADRGACDDARAIGGLAFKSRSI
jgi:hypothetical protein